ncbi:hypothetical protein [Pseudomonas sp. MUP55]|uniref:hypothetical protein n=1 Tax=Pseudomonas sp. MUP55 TaxID=3087234 RepID=UPI002A5AB7E4|nr:MULTISPECIES: hypothetical protein [unclassified Pseudomonas]WPN95167.1 hypothetical protein SC319_12605 [Pseudomonas sp. MUP56]WPO00696.1 hypothetical protein SC318_12605 [Pseudomonas sp. MUP55]
MENDTKLGKSKLSLKQGDIWFGKEVESVHVRGSDYIIYTMVGDDHCSWYYELKDERIDEALRVLNESQVKISYKFRGVVSGVISRLILNAVRTIFGERENKDAIASAIIALEQKIDLLVGVKVVIAQNEKFKVWMTEDNRIVHHVKKAFMTPEVGEAVKEFKILESFAIAMLPLKNHSLFFRRLAAAFAGRLESANDPLISGVFEELRLYVNKTVENGLKVRYLSIAFLITFIIVGLTFLIHRSHFFSGFLQQAIVAVSGGVLGAFISVLERSKNIIISEHETDALIFMQCVVRVFLGGVFGLILVSAVVSGVAFTLFSHSSAAMLLLGVVSGFSERLIPELIQGISMHGDKQEP